MKKATQRDTDKAGQQAFVRESVPSVALTSVCSITFKGTLNVPEFSSMGEVFSFGQCQSGNHTFIGNDRVDSGFRYHRVIQVNSDGFLEVALRNFPEKLGAFRVK